MVESYGKGAAACCDAQTFPLTACDGGQSVMSADNVAVHIQYISRSCGFRVAFTKLWAVISIWEKADVLAAGSKFFFRDGELPLACIVDDFCACKCSKRETERGKCGTGKGVKKITLVFGRVGTAL